MKSFTANNHLGPFLFRRAQSKAWMFHLWHEGGAATPCFSYRSQPSDPMSGPLEHCLRPVGTQTF